MFTKLTANLAALLLLTLLGCSSADDKPAAGEAANLNNSGNPAIDALTARIDGEANNPQLYASRAELFYENEAYDEAIQDLTKALSLDSTNVGYLHLLADIYLDYYKSRQALQTMERAAGIHPQRIPTLLKLSEFQLILRQYEPAMQTVDRILKIDPQNADAYFMFGMIFKETGDTARAINSFQESVELDPDLIDGWVNLGQLHAGLGNRIAGRYFDTALRINPGSVEALHAKADYLTAQDQLPEAIELYRRIAITDPQYEEAYFNAGLLYLELDSLAQAYRQFNLAIETNPVHVRAYYYRGYASEMQGQTGQARADYQQALRLDPDFDKPRERLNQLK